MTVRAWDGSEWSAQIQAEFTDVPVGDINRDRRVDASDVDALCQLIHGGQLEPSGDLNGDQSLDSQDLRYLIEQVLGTTTGDADLDGVFNSADLVRVFAAGTYEDGVPSNAGWSSGDWNCDGDFDSGDLVAAFQAGGYVAEAVVRRGWNRPNAGTVDVAAALVSSVSASHRRLSDPADVVAASANPHPRPHRADPPILAVDRVLAAGDRSLWPVVSRLDPFEPLAADRAFKSSILTVLPDAGDGTHRRTLQTPGGL